MADEISDFKFCAECELGNKRIPAFKSCAWCKNAFCDNCAKEQLKFTDDNKNLICEYCYEDFKVENKADFESLSEEEQRELEESKL